MLFFVPFLYNSTPSDKEDVKKMAVDAMFKLEHGVEDKQKSKEALPTLEQLKVYHVLAFFYWYNLYIVTYMYIIIAEPCVHLVCLAFSHNYPLLEFL